MQGHIYKANGGDILDILGFIGDLGAGGMYIVTLAMNGGQGAILFCFVFLYIAFAGGGPWSVDRFVLKQD